MDILDYPVTPNTINSLAATMAHSIKIGHSCSIFFSPNSGGSRAWIRFILQNNLIQKTDKSLSTSQFIYLETAEVVEQSKLGFFYTLLKKINPSNQLEYDQSSLLDIIEQLKVLALNATEKIVIFVTKLDSFKQFDESYGNLLYSIWRENKQNIIFITTIESACIKEYLEKNMGEFQEALRENIINYQQISTEDINHSILHWQKILNIKFSAQQIKLITKNSNRSLYATKLLCQLFARQPELSNSEAIKNIRDTLGSFFTQTQKTQKLKILGSKIMLDDQIINEHFSPNERMLFLYLYQRKSSTISRDQIARILWGNETDTKYSDYSIDKNISNMRIKLRELNMPVQIQTIKGKGYLMED